MTYPAILDELGRGKPVQLTGIGGGCIADARVATFADGSSVFVKCAAGTPGMFEREAEGLRALAAAGAIRIPEVLAVGDETLLQEQHGVLPVTEVGEEVKHREGGGRKVLEEDVDELIEDELLALSAAGPARLEGEEEEVLNFFPGGGRSEEGGGEGRDLREVHPANGLVEEVEQVVLELGAGHLSVPILTDPAGVGGVGEGPRVECGGGRRLGPLVRGRHCSMQYYCVYEGRCSAMVEGGGAGGESG